MSSKKTRMILTNTELILNISARQKPKTQMNILPNSGMPLLKIRNAVIPITIWALP
jgi:hypothetical protein